MIYVLITKLQAYGIGEETPFCLIEDQILSINYCRNGRMEVTKIGQVPVDLGVPQGSILTQIDSGQLMPVLYNIPMSPLQLCLTNVTSTCKIDVVSIINNLFSQNFLVLNFIKSNIV